ncbi:hypothetical protein V8C86DRAFT_2596617, partial [Haematococcus lacustris]
LHPRIQCGTTSGLTAMTPLCSAVCTNAPQPATTPGSASGSGSMTTSGPFGLAMCSSGFVWSTPSCLGCSYA